jgi:membrane protein implicated in regulation of membrane protease activity
MIDWWTSLDLSLQIFYAIGITAFGLTVLQTVLALLGMGVDGFFDLFHVDLGVPDGSGLGLVSSHTISAFLLGFGWGGVLAIEGGLSPLAATGVGIGAGLAMMFAMFFLIRALLNLQSSGNLDYASAIGSEATVYVTLPGDNHDGGGQIQLMVHGKWITASARSRDSKPIPPGEKVRVIGLDGPTSYYVESL